MDLIKGIVLFFAAVLLGYSDRSTGEVRVIATAGFDIEFTEEEKAAIKAAPDKLVAEPSEALVAAIAAGDADAVVLDQRGGIDIRYPLLVVINYPALSVNEFRTIRPSVMCEGSIYPAIWDYCVENSETQLDIPGHGTIHVNHDSITKVSAELAIAILNFAKLVSPTGEPIAGKDVYSIRYMKSSGLYTLTARSAKGDHCSIHMRETRDSVAKTYEIADWSCQ